MRKIITLLSLSVLSYSLAYNQLNKVNHWESVFYADAIVKYWTNNDGDPESDWRNNNFNDDHWHEGPGGIGYGDDDDGTIDTCTAVFMRKQFSIGDISQIEAAILNIDYDDAFVAYLNGVEIARSVGLNDAFPDIHQFSTAQHDAVLPEGGVPENYFVDEDILNANLKSGTNTLAIQVHNANATSSDLSSNTWFSVGLNTSSQVYLNTPSWFSPPEPPEEFNTNLPILLINTNGQSIPDEPKITANLGIIYNGPGKINNINDNPNHYDGYIGIELRGNSTQRYPKKPYNIETRNNLGENLNVWILDMPGENDWVLRASYFDHTFIRNPLADHMSRLCGQWAARTRHVEVFLNGDYQGIYILMEKIKRDKYRVDIATLLPTDIDGEELTGGYIYEITGFESDLGEDRRLKYPKYRLAPIEQINYITEHDNAFRTLMASNSYDDPTNGYMAWIDIKSFIDEIVVQEAMKNSDAYGWSGYFHKDKNGPIKAGPVWDFDQSAGNSTHAGGQYTEDWILDMGTSGNHPFFWQILFADPFFKYTVKQRWEDLRQDKFKTGNLLAYVDSIAELLSVPQEREFEKWPVLATFVWRETPGYDERDTYQKEVDYLKEYLTERWEWIDDQLKSVQEPSGYVYPIVETPVVPDIVDTTKTEPTDIINDNYITSASLRAYPNPASSFIIFDFSLYEAGDALIDIYNNTGALVSRLNIRVIGGKNQYLMSLNHIHNPGIYFYKISINQKETFSGRFMKIN